MGGGRGACDRQGHRGPPWRRAHAGQLLFSELCLSLVPRWDNPWPKGSVSIVRASGVRHGPAAIISSRFGKKKKKDPMNATRAWLA